MTYRVMIVALLLALLLLGCTTTNSVVADNNEKFNEHLSHGKAFYKEGQFDQALKEYKEAISIRPDSDEAHFLLAYVYFAMYLESHDAAQRNRLEDTFVHGRRITDENTSQEELQRIYESYGLRSDYNVLATQEFTIAARLNPDNWMAHYHVAVDHENHGRFKEAVEEYKQALRVNPQHEISYSGLADAYYKLGQHDLAIENYKKAIALSNEISSSDYGLALAYLKVGKREKAVEILQQMRQHESILYDSLYLAIYGQMPPR